MLPKPGHIAAVFLLRPMDDLIYTHFPTLCYTASLAHPDQLPTRLVLLDPSVEKTLTEVLAYSRVSVLALLDDGASGRLVELVRELVDPPDVPWLKSIVDPRWLGTQIDVQ